MDNLIDNDSQQPVKVKRTEEELEKVLADMQPELMAQIKQVRSEGLYSAGLLFNNMLAVASSYLGENTHEDDVVKLAQLIWKKTTP